MAERTERSADESSLIESALRRFKIAAEADEAQRRLELDDLKFCDDPDGQWDQEHRKARMAGVEAGVAIQARPCLTINQVKPTVQQVANEARNARLSIQVNPKGDGASQKTAEMIKGLYRNIEVESRAQMARMRALERAIKCGRGYYRVLKAYANDGDDDLDLIIEPILNQHSVFLDPFHQKPDGSDARYAFVVEDMPWEEYKKTYPDSHMSSMEEGELAALGTDAPDWVGGDSSARTIRVAEYWEARPVKKQAKQSTRVVETHEVKWKKINAYEVLEKEDWEGRYIPIVQVIGDEANINGKRTYSGIVRNAKDANRVYNVMASAEMETIGMTSKAPWIVAEGQLEGYERFWSQAHIKSYAWLTYRMKGLAGTLAPPPQRNSLEPPIQAISLARRQAREDIQTTTNTYDPGLGKGEKGDSGRKVMALQAQGKNANSHFLTGFAEVSMTHEANIIIDLMPHVYDRMGRIVKILTGDDDSASSVMLGTPFVHGDNGEPVPTSAEDPNAKTFTWDGRYSVTATVGKSFSSAHEEADAMLTEIAAAVPQMVPLFADLWVRTKDIPYGDEIADRFKKMLPPQLQDEQQGQNDPEQLKAQIQQMTMQLQQAQQEAQDAQAGIAKAKIDAESREKIKGAELQQKGEIEQMKAQLAEMKIMIEAGLKEKQIQADVAKTVMQQNAENERQQREQQHAAQQDHANRAHELATRAAEVGHEDDQHGLDLHAQREQVQTEHVHQSTEAREDRRSAKDLAKMKPKPGGKAT